MYELMKSAKAKQDPKYFVPFVVGSYMLLDDNERDLVKRGDSELIEKLESFANNDKKVEELVANIAV